MMTPVAEKQYSVLFRENKDDKMSPAYIVNVLNESCVKVQTADHALKHGYWMNPTNQELINEARKFLPKDISLSDALDYKRELDTWPTFDEIKQHAVPNYEISTNPTYFSKTPLGEYFLKEPDSPMHGGYNGHHEAVVPEIAHLIGNGHLYPPVMHHVNERHVSMKRIPGESAADSEEALGRVYDAHPHDKLRVALTDYLTGDDDRHVGNIMTTKDGRVHMIDHGFSFSPNYNKQKDHLVFNGILDPEGKHSTLDTMAERHLEVPDELLKPIVEKRNAIDGLLAKHGLGRLERRKLQERVDILNKALQMPNRKLQDIEQLHNEMADQGIERGASFSEADLNKYEERLGNWPSGTELRKYRADTIHKSANVTAFSHHPSGEYFTKNATEREGQREEVVPKMAHLMGIGEHFDHVKYHPGMVSMKKINGKTSFEDRDAAINAIAKLPLQRKHELHLFDHLIDNDDRHGGNIMTSGDQVKMIDHGYALRPFDSKVNEDLVNNPNILNSGINGEEAIHPEALKTMIHHEHHIDELLKNHGISDYARHLVSKRIQNMKDLKPGATFEDLANLHNSRVSRE